MTDIEYRLLCELAANAGRVLSHDHLLQRVWGLTNSGGSGPVRTVVKNLRRKLADDADNPTYIFNEPRRRLPDAQGRDAGTGGAVSVGIVIDGMGGCNAHAVPSLTGLEPSRYRYSPCQL